MTRRPPRSTRTDTLFPYTTLFRSDARTRASLYQALDTNDHNADLAELVRSASRSGLKGRISNYMRSEEHTSELQSLMRISYAVFCLKKKKKYNNIKKKYQ